ncbi:family 16 glycoside hydrolase [Pseudomonas sp. WC2]|uniref:family 16 glycoside hydrolase n=1 Tax=Pseudomonas sp. WC2 TaxID=3424773 RepID=UPI003D3395E1
MITKQNWVVTFGNADIGASEITHIPVRPLIPPAFVTNSPEQKLIPPHTFLRSNIEFEQGTVSWEVYISDDSGSCEILLPAEISSPQATGTAANPTESQTFELDLAIGVNNLGAPYGIAALRNYNWEPVMGVGQGSKVPTEKWISLSVRVVGSSIDMFVDGVRIISINRTMRRGQLGLFMQGNTEVKFRNLKIEAEQPLCFVVMQFTPDFNILYNDVIKPLCEEFGYRVIRGDDFYTSGQILEDITSSINSSALIIADVTPDNPNVFYEVGYAHGIGKPTILLSDRTRTRLPFDISGFRTLFYDNTIGGKAIVESKLRLHLEALRSR